MCSASLVLDYAISTASLVIGYTMCSKSLVLCYTISTASLVLGYTMCSTSLVLNYTMLYAEHLDRKTIFLSENLVRKGHINKYKMEIFFLMQYSKKILRECFIVPLSTKKMCGRFLLHNRGTTQEKCYKNIVMNFCMLFIQTPQILILCYS